MMTSAISSIAEATDAGDWYVDLGKSESMHGVIAPQAVSATYAQQPARDLLQAASSARQPTTIIHNAMRLVLHVQL